MCGITGQLRFDDQPIDPTTLVAACRRLDHRGPDETAYFFAGRQGRLTNRVTSVAELSAPARLAFGHCRLSIIDLQGGQQPMSNEDGTVWITYNGEIYNFRELQTLLAGRGHQFKTRSDTEVIVHLYEEFGPACVERLRGQFAFAIWDGRKNELFLARDRVGIKPLYYYHDADQLVFGSELKAILPFAGVPQTLDLTAVADYLAYNYVPSPKTMFRNLRKLPPAHWLHVASDGRATMQRYWQFRFASPDAYQPQSEADYLEQLRATLHEAVSLRMISDVPLGAFLSGGIDSSTVVALMSKTATAPIKTFTIGFEDAQLSEARLARLTAERYSTDHHERLVTPDFLPFLPALVRQFDEPLADASLVPTFHVAQLARQTVTVALSGDGGDECFAGYNRYWYNLMLSRLDFLPAWGRRRVLASLGRHWPSGLKGQKLLRRLALSPPDRFRDFVGCLPMATYEQVWHPEARAALTQAPQNGIHPTFLDDWWQKGASLDKLSQMQFVDFHSYLPEDILVKVDRASMLNSLEVRTPFLDHKLLNLAARIPPTLRQRGRTTKYILRQLARDLLPSALLDKPKQGFGPPIAAWFRDELRQFARDVLLDPRTRQRNLLDSRYVARLLDTHAGGRVDHSHQIWALLMLELWLRVYVDQESLTL